MQAGRVGAQSERGRHRFDEADAQPGIGEAVGPVALAEHGHAARGGRADAADEDFNADLKFPNLKGSVHVYFDERLVPHVFADNDEDMFFAQGYLHVQ